MHRVITLWAVLLATLILVACPSALAQQESQTVTVSGSTVTFFNGKQAGNAGWEYIISGVPDSVSIVLKGCYRGGTCDTLDTYTTVANSIRKPTYTAVYDNFQITPTWVNGTSVSVKINSNLSTTGRLGGGGGGGGAVNSVFGRAGDVVASNGDYVASQITNAFDVTTLNDLFMISTPGGNPAAGYLRFYAKTGNLICTKTSAGVEACLGTGGGTPGGSTTQAQYNNAGAFGGATGLTFPAGTYGVLTNPRINQANDSNGNPVLIFGTAASAVNRWYMLNGATTFDVLLQPDPTGGDANVGVQAGAKGSAAWKFTSDVNPFVNNTYSNGTSNYWFQTKTNKLYVGDITGLAKFSGTSAPGAAAIAADIYGLFSGTCNASSFLRGDGSCAIPSVGAATSVAAVSNNTDFISAPKTSSGACHIRTDVNDNWSFDCPIVVSLSTQLLMTGVNATCSTAPSAGSTTVCTETTNGFKSLDSSGQAKYMVKPNAGVAHSFFQTFGADGSLGTGQPATTDLSDVNAAGSADGQLLIYNNSTHKYIPATITAGSNVTVTNTPGGISIAATGGGGGGTATKDGSCTGTVGSGSFFFQGYGGNGGTCAATDLGNGKPFPHAGSVLNFYSSNVTAGGNAADKLRVRVKSATGDRIYNLACTYGTGVSCNDTTHTVYVSVGDQLRVEGVTAAATGANFSWSMDYSSTTGSNSAITVTVTGPASCTTCSVASGATSTTFTAVLTNDFGSQGATFALGTLACGSVNSSTGVYDATGGTPCGGGESGTIVATSVADTSKSGTVTVNITGGTPTIGNVNPVNTCTAGGTTCTTSGTAVTAGQTVALGVVVFNATDAVTSVTGSTCGTYTKAPSSTDGLTWTYLYYAKCSGSGTETVTLNFGISVGVVTVFAGINNLNPTTPYTGVKGNNGTTSSNPTVTTNSGSATNGILIGLVRPESVNAAPAAGYTDISGTGTGVDFMYKIVSGSSTTFTSNWTASTDLWNAVNMLLVP